MGIHGEHSVSGKRVDAVERALEVLNACAEGGGAVPLKELARRTGLYKSTILRLAGSLEHYGYLVRDRDGAFRLGPAAGRLGVAYRHGFDLADHVRPALARIAAQTSETASFYVREGSERICRFRHNSSRELRHHLEEGDALPLDRGAAGRVLLAFSGQRGKTAERVRRQGFYISRGERDPDVAAVSVPVLLSDGSLGGALAVSGLRTRFSDAMEKRALDSLRREADALTELLSGTA